MLDRAIVLAAFSIRRMIEKKLITDKLARKKIEVRTFPSNTSNYRQPYQSDTGGSTFENYNLKKAEIKNFKISDLVNEIIHAYQLMYIYNENSIPNGLLIASDWNMKTRLLHLTIEEFDVMVQLVLNDRVLTTKDSWDPETGTVHAIRE